MKIGEIGYQREWAKRNPEKVRGYQRKFLERQRQRILEFYGSKCEKCGFNDSRALRVDTREKTVAKICEDIVWGEKTSQLLCANCWILDGEKEIKMKGTGNLVTPLNLPD
jgi:hypothetical protein